MSSDRDMFVDAALDYRIWRRQPDGSWLLTEERGSKLDAVKLRWAAPGTCSDPVD